MPTLAHASTQPLRADKRRAAPTRAASARGGAVDPLSSSPPRLQRCACGGGCPSCGVRGDDHGPVDANTGSAGAAPATSLRDVFPAPPPAPVVETKTVTVQPVAIADDDGRNPTSVPSFEAARRIWGRCCIDLAVNATVTVNKSSFKELRTAGGCRPWGEARRLVNAAGITDGAVSVFVPDTFRHLGKSGKDVHGGGFAADAATSNPKVFIVSGADSTVVAHELGHAMGHSTCLGKSGHQPPGTVMQPSDAHDNPVSRRVSPEICANVRAFSGAASSGAANCTQALD